MGLGAAIVRTGVMNHPAGGHRDTETGEMAHTGHELGPTLGVTLLCHQRFCSDAVARGPPAYLISFYIIF